VRVAIVSTSVAVTVAWASTAPLESSTVPEIALDVPLCAANNSVLTMVNIEKQRKK